MNKWIKFKISCLLFNASCTKNLRHFWQALEWTKYFLKNIFPRTFFLKNLNLSRKVVNINFGILLCKIEFLKLIHSFTHKLKF